MNTYYPTGYLKSIDKSSVDKSQVDFWLWELLFPENKMYKELKEKTKLEKEITELENWLKLNAVRFPETKAVFYLYLENKKELPLTFIRQAYLLLKSITERWPPKTQEEKKRFARQLVILQDKLPAVKKNFYYTKLSTILKDTWNLTKKDIIAIAKTTFEVMKWIPLVAVPGLAIILYFVLKGRMRSL